jgi:4-hydroxy-L-threonine phosphate dehydrogenase PdxA
MSIAITMGDAAGIGPEIIVGALTARIRSPARW